MCERGSPVRASVVPSGSCWDTVMSASACTSSQDSAEHTARWRTVQCRHSLRALPSILSDAVENCSGPGTGRDMVLAHGGEWQMILHTVGGGAVRLELASVSPTELQEFRP